MPKNVLIFKNIEELKPVGGSSGYLHNMKRGLDSLGIKSIEFIRPLSTENKKESASNKLWSKIPKEMRRIVSNLLLIQKVFKGTSNIKLDISKYDVIHFHSTLSLYLNRKLISGFNGEVLLSSHSPKPWHKEVYEDQFNSIERFLYKPLYRFFEKVDIDAFTQADYIVFPCEEAEEPYQKNWGKYDTITHSKRKNYRYVPTGIEASQIKLSRSQILKKYNIPNDAFVICYVGRHNETKGYDLLREIGSEILKYHHDVVFLIAGKEEPLKGLENERWIEVGWTKDPHSIIAASDIFMLPNKETYFDLIMLEVLSIGKIVIAKETGGNKFFKNYSNHAIKFFESKEEAISHIEFYIKESKNVIEIEGNKNQDLFNKEFGLKTFINNYIKMIEEL